MSKSRTPLPGAMMPREEQEKLAPATTPAKKAEVANDRKPKAHYSDGGDKNQTVPI